MYHPSTDVQSFSKLPVECVRAFDIYAGDSILSVSKRKHQVVRVAILSNQAKI